MATHTALVRVYCGGEIIKPGEPCTYDGPANWKYRPLDKAERTKWEAALAQPERVIEANAADVGLTPSGYIAEPTFGDEGLH